MNNYFTCIGINKRLAFRVKIIIMHQCIKLKEIPVFPAKIYAVF